MVFIDLFNKNLNSPAIKCVRSSAIWAIEALLQGSPSNDSLTSALKTVAASDTDRTCRLHANIVLGRDADAIMLKEDVLRREQSTERGATAPPLHGYGEATRMAEEDDMDLDDTGDSDRFEEEQDELVSMMEQKCRVNGDDDGEVEEVHEEEERDTFTLAIDDRVLERARQSAGKFGRLYGR